MVAGVPAGQRASHRVIARLRATGATSKANAQPLPDLSSIQRRQVHRLTEAGALHLVGSDRYFVDEEAWAEYRRAMRVRILALVSVVLAAVAAVALFARRG